MDGRGIAGAFVLLVVVTIAANGCGGEHGTCNTATGLERCSARERDSCVEGCRLELSCNPLECRGYGTESACATNAICEWDGYDCRNPESCHELDEQTCDANESCSWAEVCTGAPTGCSERTTKAECGASEFCEWSSVPAL